MAGDLESTVRVGGIRNFILPVRSMHNIKNN